LTKTSFSAVLYEVEVAIMAYTPQRGARMLEKVIKSALGNAESQNERDLDELVVADARIDQGPMFKRVRPRARGMAFMVKKRMAHIKVSLTTFEDL
jgi:large subunit ribosomal protein L22